MKEDLRSGFVHQALLRPDAPAIIDIRPCNASTSFSTTTPTSSSTTTTTTTGLAASTGSTASTFQTSATTTSYSQLWWLSCSFSTILQNQVKLKAGEMVGLFCTTSLEAIVALLGTLMAGGAYLPFDLAQPASRNRLLFDRVKADMRVMVVQSLDTVRECIGEELCRRVNLIVVDEKGKVQQVLPPIKKKVAFLDPTSAPTSLAVEAPTPASPSLVSATASGRSISSPSKPLHSPGGLGSMKGSSSGMGPPPAYVMMTSGTTGEPKLIRVRHCCVVPNVRQLRQTWAMSGPSASTASATSSSSQPSPPPSGDVVLMTSPLAFDPSVIDIFVALSSGSCLVLIPPRTRSSPTLLYRVINEHRVSVMQCTPSLFMRFNHSQRHDILQQLRVLAMGGERFPSLYHIHPDLVFNPSSFPKLSIYSLYGTTELSVWAIINRVFPSQPQVGAKLLSTSGFSASEEVSSDEEVPLGEPMEQTIVLVRDLNTQEIVDCGIGELWIGRTASGSGIHIPPIPTGDIVKVWPNKSITFEGRKDRQLKINGVRVCPEHVERTILQFMGVVQCCVIYSEDQGILKAFVVSHLPFSKREIAKRIVQELQDKLPSVMIPTIYIIPRLPVTSNGKVDAVYLLESCVHSPCSLASSTRSAQSTRTTQEEVWEVIEEFSELYLVSVSTQSDTAKEWVSPEFLQEQQSLTFDSTSKRSEEDDELEAQEDRSNQSVITIEGKRLRSEDSPMDERPTKKLKKEASMDPAGYFVQYGSSIDAIRLIDFVFSHFGIVNETMSGDSNTGNTNARFDMLQTLVHQPLESFVEAICGLLSRPAQQRKSLMASSLWQSTSNLNLSFAFDYGVVEEWKSWHDSSSERSSSPMLPNPLTPTLLSSLQLQVQWKRFMGKCLDSSPLVVTRRLSPGGGITISQTAYIGSHSSLFTATAMETGHSLWSLELGGRIDSSAALSVDGKSIAVGCYDGFVYFIDAILGTVKWKYQTGGEVRSTPCVDPETGYFWVGSYDGYLYCLDLQRETCVRKFEVGSFILSSPVIDSQRKRVYVGSHSNAFFAFSTSPSHALELEAEALWKFNTGAPIFSTPAVDPTSGNVLFGCCDKKLYCLSPEGKLVWCSEALGGPIFSSPLVANYAHPAPAAVVGCHDGHVYFLSLKDGQILAQVPTESGVYSSVATVSEALGLICACTMKGKVLIIDMNTARILCELQLPKGVFQSSPVIVSASSTSSPTTSTAGTAGVDVPASTQLTELKIVVGCRDDNLYCLRFDLQSGAMA